MSHEYDDPVPPEDAALLADVAAALGPDDPPAGLVARAAGLVTYMDVDLELLALLEEAAAEPVGSRGAATRDRLTFELGDGSVSLEVWTDGGAVVGQMLVGTASAIDVETLDRVETTPVDDLGRFALLPAPAGPVRLRMRDGADRPLATDWFLL